MEAYATRPILEKNSRQIGSFLLAIPWHIYAVVFGSTSIIVGLIWDISWHISIGRDTFWSPPHMATYLGGVVAGLASGIQVLKVTFSGTAQERAATVGIWGFRGPLGGWFCIWGAFAMLTSAPFDDWWHDTYGLDVKILSPPHVVLALGIAAIQLGAMISVLPLQNQPIQYKAGEDLRTANTRLKHLQFMYLYASGILLTLITIMASGYTVRGLMHSAIFYYISGGIFPVLLVAVGRASSTRWPATTMAAMYTFITLAMLWVLPLFPAEAKLGPIRNPVTHMVPMYFPLLLVIPALAIDWLMHRFIHLGDWLQAVLLGTAFLGILLVVQWYFANFLMSPYSRNWVFATHYVPYYSNPVSEFKFKFNPKYSPGIGWFWPGLPIALAVAILSARLGLKWGKWMGRVQR